MGAGELADNGLSALARRRVVQRGQEPRELLAGAVPVDRADYLEQRSPGDEPGDEEHGVGTAGGDLGQERHPRFARERGQYADLTRPRATYREALAAVLDYRSWHSFELLLVTPGEGEARLTRAKHSVMSGGEKSAAIHLPLFAAAKALYSSAKDQCPRLIALDEAFVGIDERYKPDLFGLAVKFDLDLFMTGHDLWVTTATVPMIAHYDLYHDKVTRTTSALLLLWDGQQLFDATAGFKDNESLTTELLGFRPTRHTPLGTDATLYVPAPDPDPSAPEDDED